MQVIRKTLQIGSEEHRWCDSYGAQELPPRIIIGAKATLSIDLRTDPSTDDSELPPLPFTQFADVVSWYFALDTDYDQSTIPPFLKTTGISVSQDADGYTILTAAIPDTDTAELREAIAAAETILFKGEIAGLDSNGDIVVCFQFPLRMVNRVYLNGDPSSEEAQEHQWLNAAEVRALIASGFVLQFSADTSSWHSTQASADRYIRFRSASSENSAWSPAIELVQGPQGEGDFNVIESVKLNGTALTVTSKAVDVQALTSITVNGTAVPVSNGVAAMTISSGGSITVDSSLSSSSTNPVQNKVVYSALADKQDKITTSNKLPYSSISGVPGTLTFTSGGSTVATYGSGTTSNVTIPLPAAGSGGGGTITVDSSLSSSSTNPVQNKVVYSALADKQDKITTSSKLPYDYISGAPSGSLIITSGGSTVATFSNNQTSSTTVALPAGGGSGSGGGIGAVTYNGASVTVSGGTAAIKGATVSSGSGSGYNPSGPVVFNGATQMASQTFSSGSASEKYSWYCRDIRITKESVPTKDDFLEGRGSIYYNGYIYFPKWLSDGFPMEKKADGTQTLSNATGTYSKVTLEDGPAGGEQEAYTNGTYYIAMTGDPGSVMWRLFRNDGTDASPSWTTLISGPSESPKANYMDFEDAAYGTFRLYFYTVTSTQDWGAITQQIAKQIRDYLYYVDIKYDPGLLALMTANALVQHVESNTQGGGTMQPVTSVSSSAIVVSAGSTYLWTLSSGAAGTMTFAGASSGYACLTNVNIRLGSSATVTVSGATLQDSLIAGKVNYCGIYFDGKAARLYVYDAMPATDATGSWTSSGDAATSNTGAEGDYTLNGSQYENTSGYYLATSGGYWRLFNSSSNSIATGPADSASAAGEYYGSNSDLYPVMDTSVFTVSLT